MCVCEMKREKKTVSCISRNTAFASVIVLLKSSTFIFDRERLQRRIFVFIKGGTGEGTQISSSFSKLNELILDMLNLEEFFDV